jgi:hypothetical protein
LRTLHRALEAVDGSAPALTAAADMIFNLQAVECGSNCPWTSPFSHLTIQDMEFTFNLSRLPAWINDVRRINDMDLQPTHLEKTRCLPPGFYVLR